MTQTTIKNWHEDSGTIINRMLIGYKKLLTQEQYSELLDYLYNLPVGAVCQIGIHVFRIAKKEGANVEVGPILH